MTATVGAGAIRRIIVVAEGVGADPSRLWSAAGATPEVVDQVRLPVRSLFRLWVEATRETSSLLPLVVTEQVRLDGLSLFGFAVLTSADGLDAARTAAMYFPAITNSAGWSVSVRPGAVVVDWQRAASRCAGQHCSTEASLAHFVACTRQLFGHDCPALTNVTLRHAPPPSRLRALRQFFDCPVEVLGNADRLEWSGELQHHVPRGANAAMHRYFCDQAVTSLRRVLASSSWSERVTARLFEHLGSNELHMERVAGDLGVAPRTLRRRLVAEGVSFRQLVDRVRRERAAQLLDEERDLVDIALDLGFSEASAFSRAHRRWNGEAPKQHRRRAARSG